MKIYDCRKSDQTSGVPGTVIALTEDGVHIAATGGEIVIERTRSDAGKVSAQEFVAQSGLQTNDRFGD